jgi:hypothetical protein
MTSINVAFYSVLPGPVSNVQVISHNDTTMTITWTASGDINRFEIIYNYTVNKCSDTGVPVVVDISDVSVRSHTLRGFNEDSNYTITISAINTGGSTMATASVDTLTSGNADYVIVMCMH